MSGDVNGVPVVGVTVTVPPLKWHVEINDPPQDAGNKVLVRVIVAVLPTIVIWKGFVKLLHVGMHVPTIPLTKVPVLKVGSPVLEMLFANAVVGKLRAKSANSITFLILTPPARRFLAHLNEAEDYWQSRCAQG